MDCGTLFIDVGLEAGATPWWIAAFKGEFMNMVSRVRDILVSPNAEWPVIAAEPADIGALYTGYIAPLAAIGPIATLVGAVLRGYGTGAIVILAVIGFVFALITVFIVGLVFGKVAPMFGGRDDMDRGLKLVAYSSTPYWLGGIFNLVPLLGLLALVAAIYGIYLLYLGATPVMGVPRDKAVGYTVVAVIIYIALTVLIGMVVGVVFLAMIGGAAR